MDTVNLMLLSLPAALAVAKVAILALAVVLAARGIFSPYGHAPAASTVKTPLARLHRRNAN